MNSDDRVTALVVVALLIGALAIFAGMSYSDYLTKRMPQCQEDVVLVGQGDFIEGRWTYYTCGPALDDYME